jgi:ribosomal protein L37AE/L43A
MSRIKRSIDYSVCPICFKGKVKKVDDNQYKCETCGSVWTYNSDNTCRRK